MFQTTTTTTNGGTCPKMVVDWVCLFSKAFIWNHFNYF